MSRGIGLDAASHASNDVEVEILVAKDLSSGITPSPLHLPYLLAMQ
jgi:hypothetical protein